MAISSEQLRQRFLANILQQAAPRNAAEGISSLGTSLANVIASRRQVPAAQKREADLKAKETADKIGQEVGLRDALVGLGIDPGQAGGIASAPSGLQGALLGRIPTEADTAETAATAEQTAFDRESTLFDQEIAQGRLGVAKQQAGTSARRADIAATTAARPTTAQIDTVRLPDGSVRSFRRDDPALDQALQRGGVRFNANVDAADASALGGATTATQSKAQQTLDTATDTLGVIQQFRETLRPENIGISGNIRELGIGTLGQLESFQAWTEGQTQSIIDQALQSGDTLDLSKFAVDPSLSGQRILENILAYRLAKIQDPSGRVSDQDFRNATRALGSGKKLTSIGDVLARVDAFEKTVQRTQGIAQKRLGVGTGAERRPSSGRAPVGQRRQSLGVSQEDLEFTAEQNGLTVEQVLDQLEAR